MRSWNEAAGQQVHCERTLDPKKQKFRAFAKTSFGGCHREVSMHELLTGGPGSYRFHKTDPSAPAVQILTPFRRSHHPCPKESQDFGGHMRLRN